MFNVEKKGMEGDYRKEDWWGINSGRRYWNEGKINGWIKGRGR